MDKLSDYQERKLQMLTDVIFDIGMSEYMNHCHEFLKYITEELPPKENSLRAYITVWNGELSVAMVDDENVTHLWVIKEEDRKKGNPALDARSFIDLYKETMENNVNE